MERTLYQIEGDEAALSALMAELGGDVSDEAVAAAYDAFFAEIEENKAAKLTGYGKRIRNLEAEAAALEAEAAVHAAEAARVKKRAARRLAEAQEAKDRIEAYMKRRDADRIDLPLFEFAVVTNGGQRAVEYLVKPSALPEGLRRAEWKPDDKAIRAAVGPDDQVRDESGNVVARLAPKTTRLELR